MSSVTCKQTFRWHLFPFIHSVGVTDRLSVDLRNMQTQYLSFRDRYASREAHVGPRNPMALTLALTLTQCSLLAWSVGGGIGLVRRLSPPFKVHTKFSSGRDRRIRACPFFGQVRCPPPPKSKLHLPCADGTRCCPSRPHSETSGGDGLGQYLLCSKIT